MEVTEEKRKRCVDSEGEGGEGGDLVTRTAFFANSYSVLSIFDLFRRFPPRKAMHHPAPSAPSTAGEGGHPRGPRLG